VEWVLGDLRPKSAMHVTTEIDPYSGALYARNPYNTEFPDRVAFFDVDDGSAPDLRPRRIHRPQRQPGVNPAALGRTHLSGKAGQRPGPLRRAPGGLSTWPTARSARSSSGWGWVAYPRAEDANRLVHRFRGNDAARRALEEVWHFWNHSLGAVQVETPDESLNVLTNGWLLYQTLACRMWARSGYYQSGGAFGFRDQLQDAMALVHAEPGLLRAQLLLCASRQFREGDVQHWWHPAAGPRRAHPLFRRLPVAGPGHLPLCAEQRRHRRAGGTGAVPGRPPAQPGRRVLLRPARPLSKARRACTSTACAPSATACVSASTACR
jgi:cyclic beta-1,2-glucan synthetase